MPEERVQRRLSAILSLDVAGYSRRLEADERGTLTRLKALHERLLGGEVGGHGGRLVKTTGDGALIEFPSAVEAVRYALELQREGGLRNDEPLNLRIGIAIGDVVIEGQDIYGDGVNIAARLEALAEPGSIYISGGVFEQVWNKLEVTFDDLGMQKLRNMVHPLRVYRLSSGELRTPISADSMRSTRPAVAVLPFLNMSGDPDQDYFADGLTEDIITALSTWRSFPVVARNSAFAYKGSPADVQAVAKELGAAYLLQGSVRKAGERVRITAQLIDAESGNHIWAQRFDRDLSDVFAVQDEITRRIAAVLVPELEQAETRRSAAAPRKKLDAWDCYLRGLSHVHKATRDDNARARALFEQALSIDPTYGPAHSGMAYLLNRDLLLDNFEDFEETAARCLDFARRAVELDEAAQISRVELVRALLWTGQHDLAIQEAQTAVEINPSNALAHAWLGAALAFAGRPREGALELECALELAPRDQRNRFFAVHLALACLVLGELERGLERVRMADAAQSDFLEAPLALAALLAHLGRIEEARDVLRRTAAPSLAWIERRPFWRRYREPITRTLVIAGLRKAGLS